MPINVTHANMNIDEYLSTHKICTIHTNTYKYRPLHTIHTKERDLREEGIAIQTDA